MLIRHATRMQFNTIEYFLLIPQAMRQKKCSHPDGRFSFSMCTYRNLSRDNMVPLIVVSRTLAACCPGIIDRKIESNYIFFLKRPTNSKQKPAELWY